MTDAFPMPAVSPLSLDHAVVAAHDAALARAFYRDVLGLPLVSALRGDLWGGRPWLMMIFALGSGGEHLAVTAFSGIDRPPASPFPRDARHVAFSVGAVSDWEAWKARLTSAKADHWEENHGSQRSLYVVDPSGNVLEIATPPSAPLVARNEESVDASIDQWLLEDRHRTAAQRICLDFYERKGGRAIVVIAEAIDGSGLLEAVRARWKSLTAAMSAGIAHADQDADVSKSEARLHAMQRVAIPALGDPLPAPDVSCIRTSSDPSDVPDADIVYASKSLSPVQRAAVVARRTATIDF